ncbi:hypothetical protein ACTTAI_07730 [Rhodobacter capsulatus]|uniref:hypothetical protein n=1 Tax=Rhodobacter capsulatus TaxID=1061 RepID=UPI004027B7B4
MAGGLIKGMVAGVVVSGLGLGGVSLVMPLPQQGLGKTASPDATPSQAVALPEASEFARTGVEAPPAAPAATPVPEETPAIPAAPAQTPVIETAPALNNRAARETRNRRNAAGDRAAAANPAVALETPPQAEPAMPVPPPGEAAAPDLPPAEAAPAPAASGEITLMPDGAVVPQSPARPRVIVPGDSAGFAAAAGTKVNRLPQIGAQPQGSSVPPSGTPVKPFGKTEAAPAEVPHPRARGHRPRARALCRALRRQTRQTQRDGAAGRCRHPEGGGA